MMKDKLVFSVTSGESVKDFRRKYVVCCLSGEHAWFEEPGSELWEKCNDLTKEDPLTIVEVSHDECDRCVAEEDNRLKENPKFVECPTCSGQSYIDYVSSVGELVGYFIDCPDCFNGLVTPEKAAEITKRHQEEHAWAEYRLAKSYRHSDEEWQGRPE